MKFHHVFFCQFFFFVCYPQGYGRLDRVNAAVSPLLAGPQVLQITTSLGGGGPEAPQTVIYINLPPFGAAAHDIDVRQIIDGHTSVFTRPEPLKITDVPRRPAIGSGGDLCGKSLPHVPPSHFYELASLVVSALLCLYVIYLKSTEDGRFRF